MQTIDLIAKAKRINDEYVIPQASEMDRSSRFDMSLFEILAEAGALGMNIKKEFGGTQLTPSEMGLLHEEYGAGYLSVENALTVFCMVSEVLQRSGSEQQKLKYLNCLATGKRIGAFALTEEVNGSNFSHVKTRLIENNGIYRLTGIKKWITLGEIADFFIVFARFNENYAICIIDENDQGFSRAPIKDTLGLKANMLAELRFDECIVPSDRIICTGGIKPKLAIMSALNLARFTTACGAVGLAKVCCKEAFNYARNRQCGNENIGEFQLVKKMMTEMHASTQSAKLICRYAADVMEKQNHKSLLPILTAKYVASKTAVEVSNKAVQIFAAKGTSNECAIERLYRDARILEIVEGTTQIHEILIGSELMRREYESV